MDRITISIRFSARDKPTRHRLHGVAHRGWKSVVPPHQNPPLPHRVPGQTGTSGNCLSVVGHVTSHGGSRSTCPRPPRK
jgi:hypothetical protein